MICISGDDADATAVVAGLRSPIGFEVINLGSLREGGLLQPAGGQLAGKEIVTFEEDEVICSFFSASRPAMLTDLLPWHPRQLR